jgi:membrane protease YdiL (CAAX protease family)
VDRQRVNSGFILTCVLGLAFVLWFVIFVIRPFNFWLSMTCATVLLSLLSTCLGFPLFKKKEWSLSNLILGITSALVLYGIFRLGNFILIQFDEWFLPDRADNIRAVYANRDSLSPVFVGLLLFFPIGFGEEIFWRGFIQRQLSLRMRNGYALLLGTFFYTAVHIPTGNVMLILAALCCGLFWGGLFLASRSVVPVLISHMIWDPLIFIAAPIR